MIFPHWNTILKSKSCVLFLRIQKEISSFSEKFVILYQGTYYLNMNYFTRICPQACTFSFEDAMGW